MTCSVSDAFDKIHMEVYQALLDSFDFIEESGDEVGYADINDALFINARVVLDVAHLIKHQAELSDNEDIKFVLYLASLAVAESVKMTHQHITGLNVDTMFR